MKELQRILSFVRRAVTDYDMIRDGDKIAVGISGGKDSLTLLVALAEMRRFFPVSYELVGITVDMGFSDLDFGDLRAFCEGLSVPYHIVSTEIAKVIFDIRKETNPCSLCSKMRRGALDRAAKELGCNKIALGHHFDDAVVTFMLNLFHEGRLGCFSPVSYLSRSDLTMIRPLIYAKEKDVRYFAGKNDLPVFHSPCPEDKMTEREVMKQTLADLEKRLPGLRHRIYVAMCKGEIDGWKPTGRLPL